MALVCIPNLLDRSSCFHFGDRSWFIIIIEESYINASNASFVCL